MIWTTREIPLSGNGVYQALTEFVAATALLLAGERSKFNAYCRLTGILAFST
jgi:hypothetical protein